MIEMVGVLAIITILASMLIPRILSAIDGARLSAAVASVNTVRAAAMDYFSKYGRFAGTNGVAVTAPVDDWDISVLIPEGLMDTPFETSVAVTNQVRLLAAVSAATVPTESNSAFNLDNDTSNGANDAPGQHVIVVYLGTVTIQDAVEINNRIDSQLDRVPQGSTDANTLGRVKYAVSASGVTDVYIYVAHK